MTTVLTEPEKRLATYRSPAIHASVPWSIAATMLIFCVVVLWSANAFWLSTLTSAVALALPIAGLSLLYGQLGLVSLSQMALVGVGGWVALRVSHGLGAPFEFSLLAGGVSAATVGALFGLPALKMRGLYLALVTLMLAGAFQILITAWGFPDGGGGFLGRATGTSRLTMVRPAIATGAQAYFIYTAAVATGGLMLGQWFRGGRAGRAWALIRKGDAVAMASGVNILQQKLFAFTFSGFLAGLAGALLAGNVGILDGRAFSAFESLNLFALAVVGGAYHWYGSLIAGVLLRAVPAALIAFQVDGYVAIGILGAASFHALATSPRGIAGGLSGLWERRRLRSRRRKDSAE